MINLNSPIIPIPAITYSLDDEVFINTDDEGNIIGEPYSYNEYIERVKSYSGINEELLGPMNDENREGSPYGNSSSNFKIEYTTATTAYKS
jgi:hypothetical protein